MSSRRLASSGPRGSHASVGTSLLLNGAPLTFNRDAIIRVGRLPYEDRDHLDGLRHELEGTHVVRRQGDAIEMVVLNADSELQGIAKEVEAGKVTNLVAGMLSEWIVNHFTGLGRRVFRRRSSLLVVSDRPEHDLGAQAFAQLQPSWLDFRLAYALDVRVEHGTKGPYVLLLIDTVARPSINAPVSTLFAEGLPVQGLYVQRSDSASDTRLEGGRRLTGRIAAVGDGTLRLDDHDDGWHELPAADAYIEPRMEVVAQLVSYRLNNGDPAQTLQRLRDTAGEVASGRRKLQDIRAFAAHLRRQEVKLCSGLESAFGKLITAKHKFPPYEVVSKPTLIFDPSGRRTNRWNQGGLDQHGPYDRYQFNPKRLNIAVLCSAAEQGRVEQCIGQILHGVSGQRGGDVGFLRRFALEKPTVQVFTAESEAAGAYKAAAVRAVEHFTDRGETLNLAIVQTRAEMEERDGDRNPYLVSKAFFLSKGIAVQHIHFETICQPERQRAYSLNNVGLACYAKLGGVPWLLPSDQTVAHELVIGLGSHHERVSRFGTGDRYVGITTVFSGDGRYLLESRTRAVPFEDYGKSLLDSTRAALQKVREDYAWGTEDPVRLIFHAFKPVKDVEARAAQDLMKELALPHAEFAFLHVADSHPFLVFDEHESGANAGRGAKKGSHAPPRGLVVRLGQLEALLCLKGARELKQATDGHPAPLLLRLHRSSSFRDITYLARQAFAFACHSWRSFLPAPLPITVLYSQLVAENLRKLSSVSGWTDDAIVGRIGRTRWFL